MKFTIGADPEFFLKTSQGKLIPSIGRIGGSKVHPKPIMGGGGFAVQEDNVAVEFNIPPANTRTEFIQNISQTLDYLVEEVKQKGLEISITASAEFPSDALDHPKAKEFGCDPDFNAWSFKENPPPKCDNPNLRSAGGNIHIGTKLDIIQVIRAADLFVGVPSIQYDDDVQRRKLYGKAGAFRPTSYGVEYRTLSNFWLREKKYVGWVYDQIEAALLFVEKKQVKNPKAFLSEDRDDIENCINNGDLMLMLKLAEKYDIPLLSL